MSIYIQTIGSKAQKATGGDKSRRANRKEKAGQDRKTSRSMAATVMGSRPRNTVRPPGSDTPRAGTVFGVRNSAASAGTVSLPGIRIGGNGHSSGSRTAYGTRSRPESGKTRALSAITPWKVILASFLIGICGILYISHLFGTQQALQEVRQLENEYNRIHRIYMQHRLEHDRLTGPKDIYERARREGFINAGPADRVISVNP